MGNFMGGAGKSERYILRGMANAYEGSDLALERKRADTELQGVEYRVDYGGIGTWERIRISSEEGAHSIGRPMGHYDTLTLPRMDTLDAQETDDAVEEMARELCRITEHAGAHPERILVIGLGNPTLTPDSVGTRSAEMVRPTMHIAEDDPALMAALDCSEIAVITPGVRPCSGISTESYVKGIVSATTPDMVIAVDSMAAGSPSRLGSTVQICDTGIHPGSGMRRRKDALNSETLGVPVIAIGVPTVIHADLLVREHAELRAASEGERMFVSPTEIGAIVQSAARIISGGINQAFGTTL